MTGGWRIAVRNLARNRRRNLATGLAIALGYAAMVLISGYSNLAHQGLGTMTIYLQHVGHLSIFKPGGLERATAKPAEHAFNGEEREAITRLLASDPRVEFSGRYLRAGGLLGDGCRSFPFIAIGVEPEVERRILGHPRVRRWARDRWRPVEGVSLPDAGGEEPSVALAVGLASKLKKHPTAGPAGPAAPLDCATREGATGDPWVQLAALDFEGSFNALDARVTTIYRATLADEDNFALTVHLGTLQRLLATDRVTSFSVYLLDRDDARDVERDLVSRLAAAGVAAEVHRFDELDANPIYAGTLQLIGTMLGFVALLVVTVATLSVLNAMTLTVMERTRELATFRSLGFTRGQVTGLFLREALALTAVGIAVGLVVGLGLSALVSAADFRIEGAGLAGTFPLELAPTLTDCLVAAAAYFPLSAAATWLAVRRSVGQSVAQLLTAVTA